jgi:hypothetical protein
MTKVAGSGSESISHRHGSADPDPDQHQNVMDLQHWFLDFKGSNSIFFFRILFCARSGGVYACQRLVLGHHWPVASHQLAVLSRVWLLAGRLVDSLAATHSQLAVIAARLPSAATAQLLSPQQLQHMAETCAGSNKIGAFAS